MTDYFHSGSGGALSRARSRIQARQQDEARAARAKKKSKKEDDGFSLGDLVPNLGLEDAVKIIPGIATGAYDLATGRGGYGHVWGNFGKGLTSSLLSTGRTLGDVATGGALEYSGLGDQIAKPIGSFLASNDAEEKAGVYEPGGISKYQEKGIIPSLIEDVGNVALGAGAAGKLAKLGEVGRAAEALRAGEAAGKAGFTEAEVAKAADVASQTGRTAKNFGEAGIRSKVLRAAGKSAAKAAEDVGVDTATAASRAGVLKATEALAHPYHALFDEAIRPLARAAQEEQIARVAKTADAGLTNAKTVDTADEAVTPETRVPEPAGVKIEMRGGRAMAVPAEAAPTSELEQAAAEAAAAVDAEPVNPTAANEALLTGNTEPTVPLFRGEPGNGEAPSGLNFHADERYARNFATDEGIVRRVDVPESVANEARATAEHLTRTGKDVLTPGTHALPPEWADASYPHESSVPPTPLQEIPEAVQGAVDASGAERVAEGAIPPRVGPHEMAQRYRRPIPEWATRLVSETAPESSTARSSRFAEAVGRGLLSGDRPVERLAKLEGWIEGRELNLVKRERELMQVAAQRAMFHHPAVQGLVQAGLDFLVGKHTADGVELTPDAINEMLGNAVIAKLTGTETLANALPEGAPREALSQIVGETGNTIPPELMTPELDAAITAAADQWRTVYKDRLAILEGGRLGSKGLENVDATSPRLNKTQVRLWNEVQADYARAARLDPQIARQADAALKKAGTAEEKIKALDNLLMDLEDRKAKAAEVVLALFGDTPPDGRTLRQVAAQMRDVASTIPATAASRDRAAGQVAVIERQVSVLRDRLAGHSADLDEQLGTVREAGDGRTARQLAAGLGPVEGETTAQARRRAYRAAHLAEKIDRTAENITRLERRKDRIQAAANQAEIVAESPTKARQRGYRAAMAAEKFDSTQAQIRAGTRRRAALQKGLEDIQRTLQEHSLPGELEKGLLTGHAQRRLDRLAKGIENPSVAATPDAWKPLYGAVKELHKMAEDNPELAAAMAEIPEGLNGMFRWAAENGVDPTFVSSMNNTQVRNLVYEQVRLGKRGIDKVEEAGTRKIRKGAQAESRGIDALAAGMLAASHEANTNALVTHIENTFMREIPVNEAGARVIPEGWHAWDAERNFLLRGERTVEGYQITGKGGPTQMIPDAVKRTIDTFSNQDKYTHVVFRAMRKVANPWRAFVLTFSPRWYVNNFVGNVVLASKEGVRLADWAAAWHSYRQRGDEAGLRQGFRDRSKPRLAQPFADIPEVTQPGIIGEIGGQPHMIPYPDGWGTGGGVRQGIRDTIEGVKMARRTGKNAVGTSGVREAYNQVASKVARANEVVDEFARAAVYHKTLRTGGTPEEALARSFEAMVDYGNLSPFEREVVRSVIPFYSWQKAMLKVVAKFPIDHPAAAGVLLQLGQLNRRMNIEEYGADLPAAYKGLIDLPFLGAINTRGFNPLADSASLLTPQGIAASVNPFVDAGVRNAMGAPEGGFVKHQRTNEFGTVVPDTSPAEDLLGIGQGLPQYQLGTGLFGGGAYPGAPVGAQAAERFSGLATYTPAQVKKIIARAVKSQKRAS